MDGGRGLTDSPGDHRAIRQALLRLEQAWNAQDAALLDTLFTPAPTVIDVHDAGQGAGVSLLPVGGQQVDAPAYCAISVQQIVPLTAALVYAAFSVQIRLHADETLSGSNRVCAAVLAREAASEEWKIRLLHVV